MFNPVIFLVPWWCLLAIVPTASGHVKMVTTRLVPVVETLPDPTPSVGEFLIDGENSIPLKLTTVTYIDASTFTTVVPVTISSTSVDEIVRQSVAVFTVPGQLAPPSSSSSEHSNGAHHVPNVDEHMGNSQPEHAGPGTIYQTVYLPSPSSTSSYGHPVTLVSTVHVNNVAATSTPSTSEVGPVVVTSVYTVYPSMSPLSSSSFSPSSSSSSSSSSFSSSVLQSQPTSTQYITVPESSDPKVVVVKPKESIEFVTVTEHAKSNVVVVEPKESPRFVTITKTETDIIVVKPKDATTVVTDNVTATKMVTSMHLITSYPHASGSELVQEPAAATVPSLVTITNTITNKVTKVHLSTSIYTPPPVTVTSFITRKHTATITSTPVVVVVAASNEHPFGVGASHTPAAYYTHQPDADPGGIQWAKGVHTNPGDLSAEFEHPKPPVWPTWDDDGHLMEGVVAPWLTASGQTVTVTVKQTETGTGAGTAAATITTVMGLEVLKAGAAAAAAAKTAARTPPSPASGAQAAVYGRAAVETTSTLTSTLTSTSTSTSFSTVEITSVVDVTLIVRPPGGVGGVRGAVHNNAQAATSTVEVTSTVETTIETTSIVHITSPTPVIEIISTITTVVANSDHAHDTQVTETTPNIVQARNLDHLVKLPLCRNPRDYITLLGTRGNPNPIYTTSWARPEHSCYPNWAITFITGTRKPHVVAPMTTAAPIIPEPEPSSNQHEPLDGAGAGTVTAIIRTRTRTRIFTTSHGTRTVTVTAAQMTHDNRIRNRNYHDDDQPDMMTWNEYGSLLITLPTTTYPTTPFQPAAAAHTSYTTPVPALHPNVKERSEKHKRSEHNITTEHNPAAENNVSNLTTSTNLTTEHNVSDITAEHNLAAEHNNQSVQSVQSVQQALVSLAALNGWDDFWAGVKEGAKELFTGAAEGVGNLFCGLIPCSR
ncbi:hypothetical protein QBC32DRAFT_382354 [Pseudoneurospora amorphoporcata]|uniref:Uncharacterized protein n=1 Tax=Pseudoneurospora amorphoporcata TaxID=241081 RepID=A0AAN6SIR7_9PEZI|nr:hypothetical protein QBC32DRAFT_382354 [Pseudoneurospora amorphoporcata]